MVGFSVIDNAAWAPGLESRPDWLAWLSDARLPHGEQVPTLAEVPALQRRRIDRLGRIAMQVVFWCEADPGTPLIFASRHGDVARSLALLATLAAREPLSPTGFSLSVHNAIVSMYSILRGERGNYLALAAGEATLETACIEAASLLADGAGTVRVVAYDAPLPDAYAGFLDGPETFHACCWKLAAAGSGGIALELDWSAAEAGADAGPETVATLPPVLALHRFLLSGAATCDRVGEGRRWRWRRHG